MKNRVMEQFMRGVFFFCACMSVAAVLTICVFLFANGFPTMAEIGFGDFLLGMKWKSRIALKDPALVATAAHTYADAMIAERERRQAERGE